MRCAGTAVVAGRASSRGQELDVLRQVRWQRPTMTVTSRMGGAGVMAEKAFSFRAAGRRRGRLRHGGAVIVVAAVIALAGTACTTASSGRVAAGPAPPAVLVLKQGADNSNGDIFIAPDGGSVGGPEIISNTGKVIWFHAVPAGEVGMPGSAGPGLREPRTRLRMAMALDGPLLVRSARRQASPHARRTSRRCPPAAWAPWQPIGERAAVWQRRAGQPGGAVHGYRGSVGRRAARDRQGRGDNYPRQQSARYRDRQPCPW